MNRLERMKDEHEQKIQQLRFTEERYEKLIAKEPDVPLIKELEEYELKDLEKAVDHLKQKHKTQEVIENLKNELSELEDVIQHVSEMDRYKEDGDGHKGNHESPASAVSGGGH